MANAPMTPEHYTELNCDQWKVDHTCQYLQDEGHGQWVNEFKERKLTGKWLRFLTVDHLEEMGITDLDDRLKVQHSIRKLWELTEQGKVRKLVPPALFKKFLISAYIGVNEKKTGSPFAWKLSEPNVCLMIPSTGIWSYTHYSSKSLTHLSSRDYETSSSLEGLTLFTLEHPTTALNTLLGHGPFSHLYDGMFIPKAPTETEGWKHEDASVDMFGHLVECNGLQQEMKKYGLVLPQDQIFIKEMIVGLDPKKVDEWPYEGRTQDKSFLYEIVANKTNGIDVDKFDYFARDCHHLGIRNNFDHLRYFRFARVCEVDGQKHICSRDKEVNNLYDMFHTRYSLHRRAYHHSVNKIMEFMIAEAFLKAGEHIQIEGSGGEMFTLSGAIHDMEAYTKLTDDVFNQILNSSDPLLDEAREILQRIITRNHYKLLAETNCTPNQIKILGANWKEELTGALQGDGLNPEDFIVLDSTMDYGSKDEDPIRKVYFYSKRDPDRAFHIPRERVSSLLPTCFSEKLIRVYCKKTDEVPLERARERFRNWCDRELSVPQGEGQEAPQQNPGGE